jgi:hypothetical protein
MGARLCRIAYTTRNRDQSVIAAPIDLGGNRIQTKIGGGVNESRKIFVLVHYLVAVTHFARKSRLGLGDAIEAEKPARRNEQEHNKEHSRSRSTTTENRRLGAHRKFCQT